MLIKEMVFNGIHIFDGEIYMLDGGGNGGPGGATDPFGEIGGFPGAMTSGLAPGELGGMGTPGIAGAGYGGQGAPSPAPDAGGDVFGGPAAAVKEPEKITEPPKTKEPEITKPKEESKLPETERKKRRKPSVLGMGEDWFTSTYLGGPKKLLGVR